MKNAPQPRDTLHTLATYVMSRLHLLLFWLVVLQYELCFRRTDLQYRRHDVGSALCGWASLILPWMFVLDHRFTVEAIGLISISGYTAIGLLYFWDIDRRIERGDCHAERKKDRAS